MRVPGLDRAVDELAAIDGSGLSDGQLHHLVLLHLELVSRLAAIRARHVAEWDRRKVWDSDGSKVGWGRLMRECSMAEATAKAEVRRAKALRRMPVTRTAFGEGKLTVDQVDLLARAAERDVEAVFARDEAVLIDEVVRPLRLPDAARLLRYWKDAAYDQLNVEPRLPNPDSRHAHAVRTFNDTVDLAGNLGVIGGTEFLEEFTDLEQIEFEADWAAAREQFGPDALPCHLPRTAAQRRADALIGMARNSRACRQGTFHQPRPLITVHTGMGALTTMCQLADGTVVAPQQVFPLLAEADIERIVFDGPSRVIDVGVRQRFFTGALRRALEARDLHCKDESGCDVPAHRCQGEHKHPYSEGGLTTQDNGEMLCANHNRQRQRKRKKKQRPPPDDTS